MLHIEKDHVYVLEGLQPTIDEEAILETLGGTEDSPMYTQIEACYKKCEEVLKAVVNPKVAILYEVYNGWPSCKAVEDAKDVIYLCMTLGEKVELIIEEASLKEEYLEALVLDTVAVAMLFDLSRQVCAKIEGWLSLKEECFSYLSPGDVGIELAYQKHIVQKAGYRIGVTNNELMVLLPSKSLSGLYIIREEEKKHSKGRRGCSSCNRKECMWRKYNC